MAAAPQPATGRGGGWAAVVVVVVVVAGGVVVRKSDTGAQKRSPCLRKVKWLATAFKKRRRWEAR